MVTRLKNYSPYVLPSHIRNILDSYTYVFNPSLVVLDHNNYLAIRVYDTKLQSILALLLVWKDKYDVKQLNLTGYFKDHLKLSKVADPKLFIMNNAVYGSFNDSHAVKDSNTLVLFKLKINSIETYHVCNYKHRTRTEKNWAFFSEENDLFVLYGINPLTILKATTVKTNSIDFEKFYEDKYQYYKNYSIGTPLMKLDNGYGFIAHKKYFRNRKLLYLGKPFIFEYKDKPKVSEGKQILIHSFKTLFGSKFKFNKNLISCTYFSGLHKTNNRLVISYGINDVNWNIAEIKPEKIWR